MKRETWLVYNLTNSVLTIGLKNTPAIHPGKSIEVLHFATKEEVGQSISLKTLILADKVRLDKMVDGDVTETVTSANVETALLPAEESQLNTSTVSVYISGSGSPISTGSKGFRRIPKTGKIVSWKVKADTSSTTSVDIKTCAFADFPSTSTLLTLSLNAETSNTASSLNYSVTEGDFLEVDVSSNDNATTLLIEITI